MMNVLILLPFLKNTGPANVVTSLVNQLIAHNIKLHVVTIFSAEQDYIDRIAHPNVTVVELNGFSISNIFKLIKYVRTNQISVVHSHCLLADIIAPWVARLGGAKSISTVHCNLEDNYTNEYQFPKGPLYYWLHRLSIALAHKVVYVSQSISRRVDASVIHNGVCPRDVSFIPSASNTINLVYAGRLIPSKNIAWLVDTVIWANKHTKHHFTLHLFGDGQLLHSMSDMSPSIICYGFVDDYQTKLPENAIFINPSLFEGMPMAVIEALACGLPTALSNIEPHQEIRAKITPGVTLFDESRESFIQAINELITSNGQVIVDKVQMRKSFEQAFSDHHMAAQYLSAYQSLVT